jgi:hypothetical protein
LRQLLAHRIEVRTLRDSFQVGDTKYPAGCWIVRCDQPYRNAAVTFLDVQEFPADEPNPPYDDIAWTWIFPAGSWIVRAPRKDVEKVANTLGLDFVAVANIPNVERHVIGIPRLAVLHTWVSTQDCGWVRYTLDQAQVPYTLISDDDVRRGKLRSRFDVILFPNSWGDFATLVHGIDPKYGPLAYTRTDQYPSHGIPDSSPDITGGMGFHAALRRGGRHVGGDRQRRYVGRRRRHHARREPCGVGNDANARLRAARHGPTAVAPGCLWLRATDERFPQQRPAVGGRRSQPRFRRPAVRDQAGACR